ncbi:hypothetical protein [Legionella oakridgensis]|uniref:Uncharacterized protein n=2 Tax=Legionella oakridgensis TaxID=29423 RepID=W0BGM3_9GAMM|nr:hypothetical protein [Legionella oakridgensis]AHE67846.1 hypothetical protein Loa_02304 [Legionella oakridgensis ATCC 33761 = DSM 21215]ETO92646.1 hypothetical protein LOR_47c08380 [Legionella oakridgensis RV-2-2007]KTD44088.1 hypothetical protein Loak_0230 [Legionella oakridgensis]STY20857.1 Uncharacterised protein [Legionella longbeachae]
MNRFIGWLISALCVSIAFANDASLISKDTEMGLLPSPFPVYVIGQDKSTVINHPYPGAEKKWLPTDNSYTEKPGCYIACYSHQSGVYSVSPTIYVMGQIRVKGQYLNRICQPEHYQNQDISKAESFKKLCSEKIASCKNIECWAGGDTGGWFGIQ